MIQRVVGEGYRDVMFQTKRARRVQSLSLGEGEDGTGSGGEYGTHLYSFWPEDSLRDFDVFFVGGELESFADVVGGAGLMGRSGLA